MMGDRDKVVFGGAKAQITIFIILGVLLLVIASFMFYSIRGFDSLRSDSAETLTELGGSESVQQYVESCLENSVLESIRIVMLNGGYYDNVKSLGLDYYTDKNGLLELPYYFLDSESSIPGIENIEQQVEIGGTELFELCIDDFRAFDDLGMTIESSLPIISVEFDEVTIVELDFPLILVIGESSFELNHFELYYSFNLLEKFDIVAEYIEEQKQTEEGFFAVGFLSEAAYFGGYGYQYGFVESQQSDSIETKDGKIVLLSYSFDESIFDEKVILNFAILLGEVEEEEFIDNSALDFDFDSNEYFAIEPEILEWNIRNEGVAYYKIPYEGLSYELDPKVDGIEIDSDGIISLDLTKFINDNYLIYVHVVNEEYSHGYPLLINVQVDYGSDLPKFVDLDDQVIMVGEKFDLTVELENPSNEVVFSIDSPFISIDEENGTMNFVATDDLVGSYTVRVDAENELGSNWMTFNLEVLKE